MIHKSSKSRVPREVERKLANIIFFLFLLGYHRDSVPENTILGSGVYILLNPGHSFYWFRLLDENSSVSNPRQYPLQS